MQTSTLVTGTSTRRKKGAK